MSTTSKVPLKDQHSTVKEESRTERSNDAPTGHDTGPATIAFFVFFLAHALAAIYSPIQDCDEVFNFWEPTHYLNHGFGMQTWEFSPEYGIRSWLYSLVHAVPPYLLSFTPMMSKKFFEFYALRLILAFVCAVCETKLFNVICRAMNPRLGLLFLIITVSSAGTFHAATAYLPSSFVMYTTCLGLADFMNRGKISKTPQGLFWFGVGTIMGWPFGGALALPFVFEEIASCLVTKDWAETFWRLLDGVMRCLGVLVIEIAIDSVLYRAFMCVPLNIINYNIFSGSSKGPNIYGTEPWHFYIRNLLINFNFWFPLALLAGPLVIYQYFYLGKPTFKLSYFPSLIFTAPFYLWFLIFTIQPHKEERFMYPAYPCLVLNAAISLHIVIINISSTNPKTLFGRIPTNLKLFTITAFILLASLLGIWRSIGLATAYRAPLQIYSSLQNPELLLPEGTNICIGKEWYRFPSSYHLPATARLKFIRSDFQGLLPGAFSETPDELFPGTFMEPEGMNDENREDLGKYTDIGKCDYLVDSWVPSGAGAGSKMEPDYVKDVKNWERVDCRPFLDVAGTGLIGRLFWMPDLAVVPATFRRKWGEYCLLKRRTSRVG